MLSMDVQVIGSPLPQAEDADGPVLAGMQRRREVPSPVPVPTSGDSMTFDAAIDIAVRPAGLDLRGPWVHGRPGDRFLYLSWGHEVDGAFVMFRRAKLMLGVLDPADLAAARSEHVLTARLSLVDERGGPACAAVRPPAIRWSLER